MSYAFPAEQFAMPAMIQDLGADEVDAVAGGFIPFAAYAVAAYLIGDGTALAFGAGALFGAGITAYAVFDD